MKLCLVLHCRPVPYNSKSHFYFKVETWKHLEQLLPRQSQNLPLCLISNICLISTAPERAWGHKDAIRETAPKPATHSRLNEMGNCQEWRQGAMPYTGAADSVCEVKAFLSATFLPPSAFREVGQLTVAVKTESSALLSSVPLLLLFLCFRRTVPLPLENCVLPIQPFSTSLRYNYKASGWLQAQSAGYQRVERVGEASL